jgi:sterol desaturase/sphingolipid hydroxylase (fatty acid hydroxylase superfamily)
MISLSNLFTTIHGWLFDTLVQPLLFALGLAEYVEPGFDAVEFVLLGMLQLGVAYLLLRPLEALWPAERWNDRRAVRVDVLYTLLDRLGVVPLGAFVLLAPLIQEVEGLLRMAGYIPGQVEDWLPGLEQHPLASFLMYLVILDFAEYWRHRLSHTFGWWWALHEIHHSQRKMSFWTDNRNHLLDNVTGEVWFALVSLAIGVPPAHFVGLLLATRFVENLSHANTRLSFGRLGELLVVSPRYHRWHHALDLPGDRRLRYGCNFAILLPVWDNLFGTLYLGQGYPATGVHDERPTERAARDSFWRQQWLGLRHLGLALAGKRNTLPLSGQHIPDSPGL